ncbi:uncharacterized protein B0P05DRAFT_548104 [Gilbertella persicaria]|uniref:uncharacterized protein n=1 Tax=Gilbertella persicaria TaxID=101096 RepID=UPI00221FC02E|nr:uncharacterized protein B0P05DRAFT_548104 [Gilbertella persicaria]KAI8074324.1 hypothetical protein B0P05DRAFT_548104 [Gilbertella persicaria]
MSFYFSSIVQFDTSDTAENELFEIFNQLPEIPAKADQTTASAIIEKLATENNFTLVTSKSEKTRMHFKCIKGQKYRNIKNLKGKARQRATKSVCNECPYLIRLQNKNNKGYKIQPLKEIK